jgi:hypothetical protein
MDRKGGINTNKGETQIKHVKNTRPRQEVQYSKPRVLSSVSFLCDCFKRKKKKRKGTKHIPVVASLSPSRVPLTDVRDGLALDRRL